MKPWEQYVSDVLDGTIPASRWIQLPANAMWTTSPQVRSAG